MITRGVLLECRTGPFPFCRALEMDAEHSRTVDRIYLSKPFASAEGRLEHLFKLYEEMTTKERLI